MYEREEHKINLMEEKSLIFKYVKTSK